MRRRSATNPVKPQRDAVSRERSAAHHVLCQKGWFLAKVRDAIRMATWTRRMRRFLLNNGAASPSRPCAGKYGKTSKPPRFTNLGQEPTFRAKGLFWETTGRTLVEV